MPDHNSLTDKRILVTGGTTGIGRATVRLLGEAGARIVTFGRNRDALDEAIETMVDATGLTADIATREGVQAVFDMVDSELGGIDMLVACAALGADPIDQMDDDAWRYVVETNLIGTMACARAALKRMEAAGGGHLLFVGSISAELKAPGESVYSATKAGLQAFAETLRKEVADRNIRVTVIQPGAVNTDMQEADDAEKRAAVESHEMLHADEIAEAIVFALTRGPQADVVTLRIEPRLQEMA
ncbi:SDR family oxidoreductase [Roseomonas aeriglobus]|nr:SDR family oxidoreductase [Roseomonas aeriglobus]